MSSKQYTKEFFEREAMKLRRENIDRAIERKQQDKKWSPLARRIAIHTDIVNMDYSEIRLITELCKSMTLQEVADKFETDAETVAAAYLVGSA